jgi:uncharacterized protein (TIGR03067 family)
MLRLWGVLVVAGAALAIAADEKKDDAKDDLKKFEGSWQLVAREQDGDKAPAEAVKTVKAVVKGNKVTITADGKTVMEAEFTLDAGKKPKTCDANVTAGEDKGKKLLAIYEIEGDTIKLCVNEKERPKEFTAKKGSGNVLETYTREKK